MGLIDINRSYKIIEGNLKIMSFQLAFNETIFFKLWWNGYMSIYPYWIVLDYVSIWAFQHDMPVYSPKILKENFA